MIKYSLIHPTRSRAKKSRETMLKWVRNMKYKSFELIVSLDADDPELDNYRIMYPKGTYIVNKNRSCVDAINNAAKVSDGEILIVVSDDSDCVENWDEMLEKELDGKYDYVLKTDDSIQGYIITLPLLDRVYYNRFGYIYHPDFFHMFADTYMTCVADITGRKLTSNLLFKHNHPGHSGGKETTDALNTRNDLSWHQGQDTFIRLMKQFSKADIQKIQDRQMIRFLRNNGVQV
jgi:TusA-related sulfurtransferase